jgi:hypothetical protein
MFENLDPKNGQAPSAPQSAPVSPFSSPAITKTNSAPAAPAKVEDMFAGVKDVGVTAVKKPGMVPASAKNSATGNRKSSGGLGGLVAIIVILVIIILAVFFAGRFLGVDFSDPSSWASKLSNLSSIFVKQGPGQTVVVNNETPAVEQPVNSVTPPVSTPVAPVVTTTAPVVVPPVATTTPAVATTTAPVATTTPIAVSKTPVFMDSDSDGLSNLEEIAFGTDSNKVDTDGDTYSDKTEVDNLFNPLGAGAISADPNVSQYNNSKEGYSVFYPKSFKIQDALNNGSAIVFSAPSSTIYSIQISVQPNTAKQDILAYFNQKFADSPAKSTDVISKNGFSGIFSADKNEYYATDDAKNNIYVISYDSAASKTDLTYHEVFLMIVHSLKGAVPVSNVATIVYKNTNLGFQISVPSSWILPKSNISEPELFSTVACSKSGKDGYYDCPGFKVERYAYGDGPDQDFADSKNMNANPVKLSSLIGGAVVNEFDNGGKPDSSDDTLFSQAYAVFFSSGHEAFLILAPDRSLESSILPTFKLLK